MWTLIDDNVNGKRPGILDHLTLRALTVSPASPFSEYELTRYLLAPPSISGKLLNASNYLILIGDIEFIFSSQNILEMYLNSCTPSHM